MFFEISVINQTCIDINIVGLNTFLIVGSRCKEAKDENTDKCKDL